MFVAGWVAGAAIIAACAGGALPGGWPAAGTAGAALLGWTALGAFSQRAGLLARPLNGVRGTRGRLSLTFDDGPDPETTPRVLDALAATGHRATFFVVGERVRAHPQLVRRAHDEGHEVAIHSMRHPWHLCFWSPRRLAEDLRQVEQLIEAAGARPAPLFRPPIAILSPRIALGARRAGLALIGYSARAYDRAPRATPERVLRRLEPRLGDGAIVLLHDVRASIGPALLPELLDQLRRRGLTSVPVGELLGAVRRR